MGQLAPFRSTLRDRTTITMTATWLVIAAASWYLLKELASVLRPLLLAVFLAYIILPVQAGLARKTSRLIGFILLGLVIAGICALIAFLTVRSAAELAIDLPQHTERVKGLIDRFRETADRWPWLADLTRETRNAADLSSSQLGDVVSAIAGTAADVFAQGLIAGVYLFFVILGAGHFPDRIRAGFEPARADNMLAMMARINAAIAGYLRAKVLASLFLAIPAVIILTIFGVKSALFWGVLTFLFNFIPYIGSAVTWTAPTLLAFLSLEPGWRPHHGGALLLTDHLLSANLIEPSLTGKAVDLSPLVVLLALAFWGSCWGIEGMLLAVPLTVVLRIVLDNMPATRPMAKLMGVSGG